MIDEEKLIRCSSEVLTDSLGVAASFVVQDAWQKTHVALKPSWTEDLALHAYFINLAVEVPEGMLTDKCKDAILRAYRAKS